MGNTVGSGGIGDSRSRQPTVGSEPYSPAGTRVDEGDGKVDSLLQRAGLRRTDSGAVVADVSTTSKVQASSTSIPLDSVGANRLEPPKPPPVTVTDKVRRGGQSFASTIDIVMNDVLLAPDAANQASASNNTLNPPVDVGSGDLRFANLADLSAENLLAAFLKVNINDPANNPETHNRLHEISTRLRQIAVEAGKKQIQKAEEAKAKAEKYAQHAEFVSKVVTALSVISSVVTLGSSLAAASAVLAAKESAMASVRQTVRAAVDQIKTQVQRAVQEAVKQAMQSGIQVGTKAGQQALHQAVDQAAEQAIKQAMQSKLQHPVQEALQQAAKDGITHSAEKAIEEAALEAAKEPLINASKDAATQALNSQAIQATTEGMTSATQQAITSAVQHGTELGAQRGMEAAARTLVQEAIEHVGKVAPEGLVGFTNSHSAAISNIGLATTASGQILDGGATYRTATLDADALEPENMARRFEHIGEQNQDDLEREADVMKRIMEDKNKVIDAVMSMSQASFNSVQNLSAANQSRA